MRSRRELARGARTGATLAMAVGLASCFPAYGIGSGSDGGGNDGGGADATGGTGADGTVTDSGDASSPPVDGGTLPSVPVCGDMSGLQSNAPWPMYGYCPTQRRRSPLPGPGTTKPTVKWSRMISPDASFSPLVTANGLVIAVSTPFSTNSAGSGMTAYDLAGAHQWTWTPPTGDDIQWAPAVGADDVLYVPCTNYVYGVGLDGKQVWRSASNYGTRSPLVVGPGPVLYVTNPGYGLWSLTADGSDNWTANVPPGVDYQTPMFGVPEAGLTIYQTANDTSLWTVTPAGSSTLLWAGDDAGTDTTLAAIAAPDGNIRISNDTDDRLYSLRPSGQVAWFWPTAGSAPPGLPHVPAVSDDSTTFVAHQGGEVVAIDPDGGLRWTTAGTGDPAPLCNSMTIDSNGVVYTGCDHGMHAYDPVAGTRHWEMNPNAGGGTGYDYGISIGLNDTLYVSCSDGYLYALAP